MVLRILNWASRVILAAIFLYSGYVKIRQPLQFAATLESYRLFPDALIIPIKDCLPWAEVALGVALLIGWKLRFFALATAGLLAMFMAALTITYARGIEADCGCFGPGDRISPLTIMRDALFLAPALYLLFESRLRARWKRGSYEGIGPEGSAGVPPNAA